MEAMISFEAEPKDIIRPEENFIKQEKRMEISLIEDATYAQKIERYNHRRCKPPMFRTGEYVLQTSNVRGQGCLEPTWEGSYIIAEAYGNNTYRLATLFGAIINRTWSSSSIRKFYA